MNDYTTIVSHISFIYQAICFIIISLIIKGTFKYLYPLNDVYCYKEHYEAKNLNNWFWKFLFKEYKIGLVWYRIFQHGLAVIFWYVAYVLFYSHFPLYAQLVELAGLMIAYYAMCFEYDFYIIGKQQDLLLQYQRENENVYWLKKLYFSGYWLFMEVEHMNFIDHGYRLEKFQWSVLVGTLIYYATSLVFLIK